MTMKWTEDLSVGVKEIDSQHKELIRRINGLIASIAQGKGREEIIPLVTFLEVYIVSHFQLEELYMQSHAYHDSDAHRQEHRDFVKCVFTLRAALEKQGPTAELVEETRRVVVDWLSEHIRKTDKTFGGFLKTKLSRTSEAPEGGLSLSAVSAEKHYIGVEGEEALLTVVDGVLEEGRHRILLSSGQQTALLTILPGMLCRIELSEGSGGFAVLSGEGTVIDSPGGQSVELHSTSFRLLAGEDRQRFRLIVHPV